MHLGFFRTALLIALVTALVPCARTQPGTSAAPPKKNVILTWRAVAFESNQDDLFVKSEGRELPLSVPAFGVSQEYRYSGPNPITLYRKPAPAADGKPASTEPVPVATLSIDPEWTRALVFLFPKKDGTLIVHPVRSDERHFNAGTLRLYNLVNQPLVLRIDGRDQTVAPGKELQVHPENGSQQVAVRYGLNKPEGLRWVGSNYFSVTATGRTTVIITRTDSDYFRPIGADGEVYPAKAVQAFSFSESVPPKE